MLCVRGMCGCTPECNKIPRPLFSPDVRVTTMGVPYRCPRHCYTTPTGPLTMPQHYAAGCLTKSQTVSAAGVDGGGDGGRAGLLGFGLWPCRTLNGSGVGSAASRIHREFRRAQGQGHGEPPGPPHAPKPRRVTHARMNGWGRGRVPGADATARTKVRPQAHGETSMHTELDLRTPTAITME